MRAVTSLLANGWRVEAEGKLYRNPGSSSLSVSSGIDWFELHGSLNFGDDLEVKLPQLLAALRRGQKVIALGDGSFGVLQEEWLQRYGLLASFGATEEDHLRFQSCRPACSMKSEVQRRRCGPRAMSTLPADCFQL